MGILQTTTMSTILPYAIVCLSAALALILRSKTALRHLAISHTIGVTTLPNVRELLAPKRMPVSLQLHARAFPNMRLVRAFGLTNTFVSSEVDVHARFTSSARKLLFTATPRGDWRPFTESTIITLDESLSSPPHPRLDYESFMQHISLKIILHTLFSVPLANLDDSGIALVAHGINKLWKLSKTPDELPPALLPQMNMCLRAWITTIENPLDFVIPTFETLWRVVAITVALIHKDAHAVHALLDFLETPTKDQFNMFHPNAPSIAAIVAEVMRLHPPTKSISRASVASPSWLRSIIPFQLATTTTLQVANIRAVQRDPQIWGPDAEDFKPMRHHPDVLTNEQSRALLGFGLGKLQCVASSWAPMAVGLIAAAVLQKAGDGLEIVEGGGIGGREGWDGWEVVF